MNAGHANRWALPFLTIWTGQQFSLAGSSLAQFALVWWVTATTGSATVLATATAAAIVPNIVLGPLVGAAVDRWSRRRVMILSDTFVALLAAWLAYLFWSGGIQIWHVYVILIARAIGGRFHHFAMRAATGLMVPREHLARVSGMTMTAMGAADIIAPPLGALLLGLMPLHGVMAIDVITGALAVGPLLFVVIPEPARAARDARRLSLLADAHDGLCYIRTWPGLLRLCMLAIALNLLCGPAFYLTPILVSKHFAGGAAELGLANSAWGIGTVLGGVLLAAWGGFRRRIVTLLVAVIGVGVGFLLVAVTPPAAFAMGLAGLFVVGALSSISGGMFPVMMQATVAPEMQGRVFAMFGSLVNTALALGMVLAGPLADTVGVLVPYAVGGLSQVVLGLAAFAVPALMRLEEARAV